MTTFTKETNPYLIALVPTLRTRAEQCLTLIYRAPFVNLRLSQAVTMANGVIPDIIDDGTQGRSPFTANHYIAFQALFTSIAQMGDVQQIMDALNSMAVRDPANITNPLPEIKPGLDPIESALKYTIRPLAPTIRAMFAQINDDDPIVPTTLAGLEDTDLIDEERQNEMIFPFSVGAVNLMFSTLQNFAGDGLSDDLARAIDAACTEGLKVS